MKLLRYGPVGSEKPGLLDAQGQIRALSAHVEDITAESLTPARLAEIERISPDSLPVVTGAPRLGTPYGGVGKFIAVGLNFSDHAAESGLAVPAEPIIFSKAISCIVGPNDDIMLPKGSVKTDWEVELGVVIGRTARYVSAERALDHVAGYCLVNDVSEREYQIERGGTWDKGKGCDTFGPFGPYLVTAAEVGDPQNLAMWLDVNGERMQTGSTQTMIFPVRTLVSYISQFMTLHPGDLITTGTPPGVGMGKKTDPHLPEGGRCDRSRHLPSGHSAATRGGLVGVSGREVAMITVFSEDHLLRSALTELSRGELVRPFECPERAEFVLKQVRAAALGEVIAPSKFGLGPILRVHDEQFVEFLSTAWSEWQHAGHRGEAIPDCWPARRMAQRRPDSIEGKLGFYAMAAETSISEGSWEAARASADVALTAAAHLHRGARAVFALCRPPGHHAARDLYGGYCFLNNAAIATQWLRDHGCERVAILDVDFHHGNGTQDIFYPRSDVFFTSLHADPREAFPYFSGYSDEIGSGAGAGFNLNLPLPGGRISPRGPPLSRSRWRASGISRPPRWSYHWVWIPSSATPSVLSN